jgi:hypothetical protein
MIMKEMIQQRRMERNKEKRKEGNQRTSTGKLGERVKDRKVIKDSKTHQGQDVALVLPSLLMRRIGKK